MNKNTQNKNHKTKLPSTLEIADNWIKVATETNLPTYSHIPLGQGACPLELGEAPHLLPLAPATWHHIRTLDNMEKRSTTTEVTRAPP